jgi:uncharacterized protein
LASIWKQNMAQLNLRTALLLACVASLALSPAEAAVKKKAKPVSSGSGVNALLVKRQYGAAIHVLEARANAGDVGAQYKLGSMYRIGLGVPSDKDRAALWLGKAARNGNASAASILKRMAVNVPPTVKKSPGSASQVSTSGQLASMDWLPARAINQPGWVSLAAARNLPKIIDILQQAQDKMFKAEQDQALLSASVAGSKDVASAMLEAGANPNVKNDRARTPVIIAAAAGNAALLSQLLKATPDLTVVDASGMTALGHAAANCDAESFKTLIDEGAKDEGSSAPALITVLKSCKNITAFLPSIRGTMSSARDTDGRTAVWHAATIDEGTIIKATLASGGDPAIADAQGFTPLHAAAMSGRVENIRLLMTLAKTADVQSTFGVTPLMLAASAGCADCTKLLAGQSSDLDIKDGAGDTALMRAVRSQHVETVQILLEKGANPKARSISGDSPEKLAERLGGPIGTLFQVP